MKSDLESAGNISIEPGVVLLVINFYCGDKLTDTFHQEVFLVFCYLFSPASGNGQAYLQVDALLTCCDKKESNLNVDALSLRVSIQKCPTFDVEVVSSRLIHVDHLITLG